MYYSDDEQLLDQPATTPVPAPAVADVAAWPPPPRLRPSQGPSRILKILSIALALLLVLGGLGLLIYSTTGQYDRALKAQNGGAASATAQSRISSQATLASQQRATAVPLQTADAQIYATATAQAAPSATASAAGAQSTATAQTMTALLTKVTTGTPALDDPLSGNTLGYEWDKGYSDNNNTGCNFINSSYQVLEALPDFLHLCFADATNFRNFAYQVSMTLNSNCGGGMILRGNNSSNKYYLFVVNANGSYLFEIYDGNKYTSIASGTSAAILGVGQANTLAVVANQGVFDLFINQTYVAEAIDGQLSAGQIGVVAYNTNLPASVSFSAAKVWKI